MPTYRDRGSQINYPRESNAVKAGQPPNCCENCGQKPAVKETLPHTWANYFYFRIACTCGKGTRIYPSRQEAIDAWNKRNQAKEGKEVE